MLYYDALHSAAGIETNGTLKNWRKDMRSLDGQKKQAKFAFVEVIKGCIMEIEYKQTKDFTADELQKLF